MKVSFSIQCFVCCLCWPVNKLFVLENWLPKRSKKQSKLPRNITFSLPVTLAKVLHVYFPHKVYLNHSIYWNITLPRLWFLYYMFIIFHFSLYLRYWVFTLPGIRWPGFLAVQRGVICTFITSKERWTCSIRYSCDTWCWNRKGKIKFSSFIMLSFGVVNHVLKLYFSVQHTRSSCI